MGEKVMREIITGEIVKKLVSLNIPDFGELQIALLENGIILSGGNGYFYNRGNDLTIYEALCEIGFPVTMENIKRVQKAIEETIYIVKFHKSSIHDGYKWTNASVFYVESENCVCHRELNFHHKIGNKEYYVHDNATMDNNLFNESRKPEITRQADSRIFNSKFLRISDGITDNYWEEARVAQRIYDREYVDEPMPDEDISIAIDANDDDNVIRAHITGNKGDITIQKAFCGDRLIFSATAKDPNAFQETIDTSIDPIAYLNNIGIHDSQNVGAILTGLGVEAYHILQFPSCETCLKKDHKGILANEKCIKRSYSVSKYDVLKSWSSSFYGYQFSESVEVFSPMRDCNQALYFAILEPLNIQVSIPEDMNFPYRNAIEKFRKEDPEMSGGTVYLNASDTRAFAVFFDE